MNICFYTDKAISGMTGGIGRITSVMVDYFRNHYGWKVYSIYSEDAENDCIKTNIEGAIKLRLHDRFNIRPYVINNYSKAVNFIRDNRIDIIIIQTSLDVVEKLHKALLHDNLQNVKILSVLHFAPGKDEWHWEKQGLKGLFAPIYNYLIHYATVKAYRTAYLHGEKVILLSNSYIKEYKKYAHLEETNKLTAIPNSLSFTETINDDEIHNKKNIALVVARMEDTQKRISLILRMWKKIEKTNSNWQLQIVGDGPSLSFYKQLSQELQLKCVSFEGRKDPVPYYKQASLFFMTSSFEGFPMTLVEASQFGCVPIAYNSFSSLSDVVSDGINGYVIPEGNESLFIDYALNLMNNKQLMNSMMYKSIDLSLRFSQDTICGKWKLLLESIIS